MVKTQPLSDNSLVPNNAIEWEDYLPTMETINFKNGETEQIIKIAILGHNHVQFPEGENATINKSEDSEAHADEIVDLMFKILIYKAEPSGVLISKKNVCIVTIV